MTILCDNETKAKELVLSIVTVFLSFYQITLLFKLKNKTKKQVAEFCFFCFE